jgi:hypothetical protein
MLIRQLFNILRERSILDGPRAGEGAGRIPQEMGIKFPLPWDWYILTIYQRLKYKFMNKIAGEEITPQGFVF